MPAAANLEKEGSQANSGRWMQWLERATENPGDCLSTGAMVSKIMHRVQGLYKKDGGVFPEPILGMDFDYMEADGKEFDAEKVALYINGFFTRDCTVNGVAYKKGQPVPGFGLLQADGSTSCGNWICSGSFTLKGENRMCWRKKEDRTGLGLYPILGVDLRASAGDIPLSLFLLCMTPLDILMQEKGYSPILNSSSQN